MFPILNTTQRSISQDIKKLDVVSNNLANTSTAAFKKHLLNYMQENGETIASSRISFQQGSTTQDNDPLHFAIHGEGFFPVQNANGVQLRRAGDFALSETAELITSTGDKVLSSGSPIVLAKTPVVLGDGTIQIDGNTIGKLDVVVPTNYGSVVEAEGGNYSFDGAVKQSEDYHVAQGFLENANTSAVNEMSSLIELTRNTDIVSKIFKTGSEVLKLASSELGKIV